MLSFEYYINKCTRQAQEREALIGLALISTMLESYANAAQGCFMSCKGLETIGIRIDFIIH